MKKRYDNVVNEYVEAFLKRQDMEGQFEHWVGNMIGGICAVGDYFFNFDDIRYDVDNEIPIGYLLEWYDDQVEIGSKDINSKDLMNFPNYCKLKEKSCELCDNYIQIEKGHSVVNANDEDDTFTICDSCYKEIPKEPNAFSKRGAFWKK